MNVNQAKKIQTRSEHTMRMGELLVKEGLVKSQDVEKALAMQKKLDNSPGLLKNRLIGMILCDLNFITPLDNYYILHKYNKKRSIESALVSDDLLSQEDVNKIVQQSDSQEIPLISRLLNTGAVSVSQMQQLLFSLFHVPFRSISNFVFNKEDRKELVNIMDRQCSSEQKIIPLVVKDKIVLFGITDPDNLLVIRQLNEHFPQYRFKTLFIPFSGYKWFSRIIYGDDQGPEAKKHKPVDLSLLLNFNTTIKDPEMEKRSVWILYERYELLRRLIGKKRRGNFQDEFNRFIQMTHQQICEKYQTGQVEYSLKKEGQEVLVVAFPKHQAKLDKP